MPPFNAGQRIKLVQMVDDPSPIESGATGTVLDCAMFQGRWQVEVKWDNGRSLSLVVPPDVAHIIG